MSFTTNPLVTEERPIGDVATTQVDDVRAELLARRAEHSARLESASNQTTTIDDGDDGAIDVGLAFERFSLDRSRDEMVDIEAAIARLDAGTYGSCETCHRPIASERLEAIPHARYCITCASSAPLSSGDRRRS